MVPAQRALVYGVLAALVPLLFLLPFANKAFHIDDTFYLWVAQKIHETPLDYYGFTVSWGLVHEPAYNANKNPPGISYYLALAALLFGWGEVAMHVATALFASALSLGTYLLARRLCALPFHATLIAVLTPGFLVSSNTVMSDVPMYALYVWAIYVWMRGLERNEQSLLVVASMLIGLSALTKYFGMTAVPLLVVYTILKRGFTARIAWLLIPVGMIAAYQLYSARLYGINLLTDAADFAVGLGWNENRFPIWAKPLAGLSFAGGCIASTLFYAPALWRRRVVIGGVFGVAGMTGALTLLAKTEFFPGRLPETPIMPYALQYALLFAGGVQIMAVAMMEYWRRRNAETTLLILWLLGAFVFSTFVNWTINARTILPMIVPAAIFIARRLEWRLDAGRWASWRTHAAPLCAAAALSMCVMWGDYRLANSAREAAEKFIADAQTYPQPYYFKGHWGFQYYMQQAGIEPFNPQGLELTDGTRIIVPVNNVIFGTFNPAVARAHREISLTLPASRWIITQRRKSGAGFYTHFAGAIPFTFGPAPLEEYAVYELGDYEGRAAGGETVPIEFYELPDQ